jgi:hypothetical protein
MDVCQLEAMMIAILEMDITVDHAPLPAGNQNDI